MHGLIDPNPVLHPILGSLHLLSGMRKCAWGPILASLEARRQKIAGDFEAARQAKADADATKLQLENELKGIEARARQRLQEAVTEGQKVAGEIRAQAQTEAAARMARAEDD